MRTTVNMTGSCTNRCSWTDGPTPKRPRSVLKRWNNEWAAAALIRKITITPRNNYWKRKKGFVRRPKIANKRKKRPGGPLCKRRWVSRANYRLGKYINSKY